MLRRVTRGSHETSECHAGSRRTCQRSDADIARVKIFAVLRNNSEQRAWLTVSRVKFSSATLPPAVPIERCPCGGSGSRSCSPSV